MHNTPPARNSDCLCMPPLHMATRVNMEINLIKSRAGFEFCDCIFPAVIFDVREDKKSCHNCFDLCDLRGVHVYPVSLEMIQDSL
eukprot:10475262-Ditylum_brightwellii.AAC.1